MSREKVTVTAAFKAAVKTYQQEHNLPSWSQALLHLAALGYERETGARAPEPHDTWGGWRGDAVSLANLKHRKP